MLTLDQSQLDQLQALDANNFVAAVCDQFLEKREDRVANPGREGVLQRMTAAYRHAVELGIQSPPTLVEFLYITADAPRFWEDASIDYQLRKPGATAEQRFDELMAVMRQQLREAP